ncbi:TlpA disulfide reductase family protein [Nonomuraea sp. NPDC046802]|uniref:TlpA disulfide reductase family protein n=1 Tax=Nonomuraea sp. NPDC046802 TaxID=3154919 RepID=UPI0033E13682
MFELVVVLGVIRRLREHTRILDSLVKDQGFADVGHVEERLPDAGVSVGAFAVTTLDGEPMNERSLRGQRLVAFFSVDCGACVDSVPGFVTFAREHAGGLSGLAVVRATPGEGTAMVEALRSVVPVVLEHNSTPVSTAFKVSAYPAYVLVDEGRVLGSAIALDRLHLPATA